ncbi:MAG TPA: 1-deoxy-D-xylulose-5-phosphate reductoisomerase [Candidatus Faecivivens stercoripullorum]|uniref:1-deoxy-D-xylulose 5-phosphate reductoisomerase n=1 Tax=Candidatus Faecivivens stercoripullorum TaxID=2840805 RepID=A0A9D1KRQ0_9FIRM|nr:1-deoxy-D-xylulose-5-phosphate reductoisomerase [Candidatus Faecivivens stercoripullorum]
MEKNVTILGSTGSIGTQALDVCRANGFNVYALAANRSEQLLEEQVRAFHPKRVCIADPEHYQSFCTRVADLDVEVLTGIDGLCALAGDENAGIVLNSVMGMIGLRPTLAAIEAGNTLALANKETLVTGGELVMKRAAEKGVRIFPVDSEHSAIFQCLEGYRHCHLNKILLTASGGPFFGMTRKELEGITPERALKHPNWSMGAKITIDSATLMNKGLEVIEAVHLFGVRPEQIEVVVHRESVIHSLVEFDDYSVIGQLGVPDMKIPIQYALTYPERTACPTGRLSLTDYGKLTFYKPDPETFVCLKAALEAISRGGLYPTLVNSANELLVELFLKGKVSFLQIGDLVSAVLGERCDGPVTLENILAAEKQAREFVLSKI